MHTLEEVYQKQEANGQRLDALAARLEAAGLGTVPGGMALVPAGVFVMGANTNAGHWGSIDELPQHAVSVSAFYLDLRETTKEQWDIVRDWGVEHGYTFSSPSADGKADEHPVQYVNWFDCVKWSNARSEMAGLAACYTVSGEVYRVGEQVPECDFRAKGYRLPTEAEWEKAARGGVGNRLFPWSDTSTIQHARANYRSNGAESYDTSPTWDYHPDYDNDPWPYTGPVGVFASNGYGLYDMAGNVSEWCWDWFDQNYYGSSSGSDPAGPPSGAYRVLRGGSWYHNASFSRAAGRGASAPEVRQGFIGFRCARSTGR
jgi:formylglycine-generating enzyme required for sulfatase activity